MVAEEISFSSFFFWVGLTAVGVGGYMWYDATRKWKRGVGIGLTVGGLLCSLLAVTRVNAFVLGVSIPSILGPIVLFASWAVVGYDIYLKRRLPTQPPPVINSKELINAPRVLVELAGVNPQRADMGYLVFISDKRAIIRNVGDLHSAERYESNHEFSLNPARIPVVDKDRPVQCRILSLQQRRTAPSLYAPDIRALADILRDGTPQSEDSVVIDYDDEDGHQFSRRFALTRNQDDSVAWIPDPVVMRGNTRVPEPANLDLAAFRHKLHLASKFLDEQRAAQQFGRQLETERHRLTKLRTTYSNVLIAAKASLLAEDAEKLLDEFDSIMEANARHDDTMLNLSRPLGRDLVYRELSEDGSPLPWQLLRLMFLREHYNRHSLQVHELALTGLDSGPLNTKLPTELGAAEIRKLLENHKKALLGKAEELSRPYFEALNEPS
jgi:hypothetical protein